jgi:septal ring factor EnvC (AmiA/AmiB activator)
VARAPAAFLAAFLAAVLLALGSAAFAQEKTRLDTIEKSLDEQQERAAAIEKEHQAIAQELEELRRRLVDAAAGTQDAEVELTRSERALRRLTKEAAKKEEQLTRRRGQMVAMLAALERLALRPADALIVAPSPPVDTVRGALLLNAALPALESRVLALRRELAELARVRAAIEETKRALATAVGDREQGIAEIEGLIARKAELLRSTEAEREAAAKRTAALAAEASDLRDLIRRIDEERRRAAAQRQSEPENFLTIPPKNDQAAPTGSQLATIAPRVPPLLEQPSLVRPFPRDPASLIMPVRGRISQHFAEAAAGGELSRGIVIESLPGAQVVAPFDGHVVFEGPFRGYGSILIIEHPGGYHTLLSGLGRSDAVVGQWLIAGEPVGVMAAGGNPKLYVELRRESQPIDPLPWLQVSGGKVKG